MPMSELVQKLPYNFRDFNLLKQALTHKSYANEKALFKRTNNTARRMDNERLEFLGDAVLDLAITELLMKHFPMDEEGSLSKKRASLVNETVLAGIAVKYGLNQAMRLGRGEETSGGRSKSRLLACATEAVLGAVFSESGYETSKQLVFEWFESLVADYDRSDKKEIDFKTNFQEYTQKVFKQIPSYEIYWFYGPSHDRNFFAEIVLAGKWIARASGKSKKIAEQLAAKKALEVFHEL